MKMTEIKRNKVKWFRAVVQLLFFIFLPGAFNGAFAGVKYIFTQLGMAQKIELTSFVTILIVLCLYTIVFGRFFCGYACAFGAFGDAVRGIYVVICKKLKKKPVKIPEKISKKLSLVKYVVVMIIVLMCFLGSYSVTRGCSPWDVFSMLHARNFKLEGYVAGVILLLLVMVLMCVEERGFCKFLCPMGAVFSLLPVLPIFALVRERDNCIPNCKGCTMQCPSGIGLPADGKYEIKGDCFQCQKCIGRCPKSNIHTGIKFIKGNEIWFTAIRVIILAGLLLWLGI